MTKALSVVNGAMFVPRLLLKRLQIVSVHVGNSPVVKVRVNPMQKLITLPHHCLRRSSCIGSGWPDEEINKMLAPLIN